jgi:hypothetical protein
VAAPPAVVVFVELPLLSPPHAAAIMAAPRSTTAALAAPAVLLKLVTSWVRDGVRGRDASGRPDNPQHRSHPHLAWGHGTHLASARRCSVSRSTGQYLPFDEWPTNGGAS